MGNREKKLSQKKKPEKKLSQPEMYGEISIFPKPVFFDLCARNGLPAVRRGTPSVFPELDVLGSSRIGWKTRFVGKLRGSARCA